MPHEFNTYRVEMELGSLHKVHSTGLPLHLAADITRQLTQNPVILFDETWDIHHSDEPSCVAMSTGENELVVSIHREEKIPESR